MGPDSEKADGRYNPDLAILNRHNILQYIVKVGKLLKKAERKMPRWVIIPDWLALSRLRNPRFIFR